MKFHDLYKSTINYYPSEIDISDGRRFQDGGVSFNNLTIAWLDAEPKARNDWEDLLIWNIFQMLHRKAKSLFFNDGEKSMRINDILDAPALEQMFLHDLHGEGWENILKEYLAATSD